MVENFEKIIKHAKISKEIVNKISYNYVFKCRTCEHSMTYNSQNFPKEFLINDFFSFVYKQSKDYTMVESYHARIFNNWCKTGNYCKPCTIENILNYSIFEGVEMDDDIIPNCPNCDSYYYKEFEHAKKRAAEIQALYAIGLKPKYKPTPMTIDNIHDI